MLRIKVFLTLSLVVAILCSCGVSQQDKEEIATITCNIIKSSRNMDAALRIKEINSAREQMGEERFLGTDDEIGEAIELGLCKLLVINDSSYKTVRNTKLAAIAETERQKEEEIRLEVERIAAEQRKKIQEEKEFIKNKYGDWEVLQKNNPWRKTNHPLSRERFKVLAVYPSKATLWRFWKETIIRVEIADTVHMGAYTPLKDPNSADDWYIQVVHISPLTNSVVFNDMRNGFTNQYFLVTVE